MAKWINNQDGTYTNPENGRRYIFRPNPIEVDSAGNPKTGSKEEKSSKNKKSKKDKMQEKLEKEGVAKKKETVDDIANELNEKYPELFEMNGGKDDYLHDALLGNLDFSELDGEEREYFEGLKERLIEAGMEAPKGLTDSEISDMKRQNARNGFYPDGQHLDLKKDQKAILDEIKNETDEYAYVEYLDELQQMPAEEKTKSLQETLDTLKKFNGNGEETPKEANFTYSQGFGFETPISDVESAQEYLSSDDMTQFMPEELKDKVAKAEWILDDESGGRVEIQTYGELTEEEQDILDNWVQGQNSDGLGEGFEQQEFAETYYNPYTGDGPYTRAKAEEEINRKIEDMNPRDWLENVDPDYLQDEVIDGIMKERGFEIYDQEARDEIYDEIEENPEYYLDEETIYNAKMETIEGDDEYDVESWYNMSSMKANNGRGFDVAPIEREETPATNPDGSKVKINADDYEFNQDGTVRGGFLEQERAKQDAFVKDLIKDAPNMTNGDIQGTIEAFIRKNYMNPEDGDRMLNEVRNAIEEPPKEIKKAVADHMLDSRNESEFEKEYKENKSATPKGARTEDGSFPAPRVIKNPTPDTAEYEAFKADDEGWKLKDNKNEMTVVDYLNGNLDDDEFQDYMISGGESRGTIDDVLEFKQNRASAKTTKESSKKKMVSSEEFNKKLDDLYQKARNGEISTREYLDLANEYENNYTTQKIEDGMAKANAPKTRTENQRANSALNRSNAEEAKQMKDSNRKGYLNQNEFYREGNAKIDAEGYKPKHSKKEAQRVEKRKYKQERANAEKQNERDFMEGKKSVQEFERDYEKYQDTIERRQDRIGNFKALKDLNKTAKQKNTQKALERLGVSTADVEEGLKDRRKELEDKKKARKERIAKRIFNK